MSDNWKHRSENMRCKGCMYFAIKAIQTDTQQQEEPPRGDVGRCRRHAPTMKGFPVVFGSDWCGDHKLDETKI